MRCANTSSCRRVTIVLSPEPGEWVLLLHLGKPALDALKRLRFDHRAHLRQGPAPCGALKGRIARAPMLNSKPVVFDEFQIGDDISQPFLVRADEVIE